MVYLVVLIAALFHAVWNGIMKESSDKLLTLGAIRGVGLILGVVVVSFLPPLDIKAVPYLICASIILFLYYFMLINAYRLGDFSQVYPIARGSAPLIVLVFGAIFAGEHLAPIQIGATLLISVGILSLSFSKGRLDLIPVGYALGTAFCVAGYTVASGMGVRMAGSFLVFAGWLEIITGLGVLLLVVVKRKREMLAHGRTHWHQGLVAGFLSVLGFAAALWAMRSAPIAPVAAIRETSIVFAALIGVFFFKEGHARQRLFSAAVVVAGIYILFSAS